MLTVMIVQAIQDILSTLTPHLLSFIRIPRHTMASDSESVVGTTFRENTTFEEILTAVKTFEAADLFKLLKAVASEAEKKTKTAAKRGSSGDTSASRKKAGSMPKGEVPPQLKKPRAWVEFTLKSALEDGWESFTIVQKKKDKETNTVTEEQIEMPGSIMHDGAHIYEDSITDKTPNGKQLIHKEAMSLSKQRKTSGHATYAEFEASYVDETDDDKSVASSTSSKKIVVKKTVAEKEAEAEAKKEAKEAEKAASKAAKEAEKEAKKQEKEAEKEAKKQEKAAAADAKKAEKKPTTKAPVPVAAVIRSKGAVSTSQSEDVKKVKADPVTPLKKKEDTVAAPVAPKKKVVAKAVEIPDDGMVHPWTHKGKKYLRNFAGETWTVAADGAVGEWAGVYDAAADKIDTSVAEPEEDDE